VKPMIRVSENIFLDQCLVPNTIKPRDLMGFYIYAVAHIVCVDFGKNVRMFLILTFRVKPIT
jgi:hypothetical protein